jgi:hypothetical protein
MESVNEEHLMFMIRGVQEYIRIATHHTELHFSVPSI